MKHVKAVIFDWAGTVVDYGSLAPMGAFVETFAEFGVEISPAELDREEWATPRKIISYMERKVDA